MKNLFRFIKGEKREVTPIEYNPYGVECVYEDKHVITGEIYKVQAFFPWDELKMKTRFGYRSVYALDVFGIPYSNYIRVEYPSDLEGTDIENAWVDKSKDWTLEEHQDEYLDKFWAWCERVCMGVTTNRRQYLIPLIF